MIDYNLRTKRWFTDDILPYDVLGVRGEIPAGFESDLASIPRLFWLVPGFGPFELGLKAPLVHDWLLRKDEEGRLKEERMTRLRADRIFLEIMRRQGIGKRRRMIAFRAVRLWSRLVLGTALLTGGIRHMMTKFSLLDGKKTILFNLIVGLIAMRIPGFRELVAENMQLSALIFTAVNVVLRKFKSWRLVTEVLMSSDREIEKVIENVKVAIQTHGGDSDPVSPPGKS